MTSAEINQTRKKSDVRSVLLNYLKRKGSLLCIAIILVFLLFGSHMRLDRTEHRGSYPWEEGFSKMEVTRYNRSYEEIYTQPPTTTFRICSQEERIRHMVKVCSGRPEARINDLMTVSKRSIHDDRHKILMCLMSKAGCTALKALFLEAAGYQIKKVRLAYSLMSVHAKDILTKYGLVKLDWVSDDNIQKILEECSIFMLIRHPFERLLSTYRGKVVDTSSDFPWFAAEALKLAKPSLFKYNKTLSDMKKPQTVLGPPTFGQFLDWIRISGTKNAHWSTIIDDCHPCAHNWSAVLRVETLQNDGKLLLEHLKPDLNVSFVPVRHSHQNEPVHDHDWLRMPEYDDINETVIDYFLRMYELDMEMFGYKWDKTTKTASCSIETENGPCC